jgi:hypothetical protein
MKTITFKEAFRILLDCSAVIWADNFLCYPCLNDEETENSNEDMFLELEITDAEGQVFSANFYRGDNEEVKIEGGSMFLSDENGEEVQITVLVPQKIS